jgi:hypothetical protein
MHQMLTSKLKKQKRSQNLKIMLQRMWNVKARVVPVVVGSLRATSPSIEKHLDNILRKVLDLPGSW